VLSTRSVLTAHSFRLIQFCALAACALVAGWAGDAQARGVAGCTDSWKSATSGAWANPAAWSTGKIPVSTDSVCITAPGTYTVTLTPYAAGNGDIVASLTLGASSGRQTLAILGQSSVSSSNEVQNTTALQLLGTGSVSSSGEIVLDATGGGTRTQGGALGGIAVLISGKVLTNLGRIVTRVEDKAWQTYFSGQLLNEHSGTVTVSTGTLSLPSPSTSGFGSANGFAITNEGGSFTVSRGASFVMEAGIGASGSFTNAGTVINDGTLVGGVSGGPMTWTQHSGSVRGKPVVLQNGAWLADLAGPGQFLFDDASGALTGTVPAGQTITVRGEPYSYQGENYNGTALNLENPQSNAPAVINRGTVVLDSPGKGTTSGGPASLAHGSLVNHGTIVTTVEDSSWTNALQVRLVNVHSGRIEVKSGVLNQNAVATTTNQGVVTVSPGAQWGLNEGGAFVNKPNGTITLQISGTRRFGSFVLTNPCCQAAGKLTASGTLSPKLIHGYKPRANTTFKLFLLEGGQFAGTFRHIGKGFAGDYSHESAGYAGATYGAAGKKKP